MSEATEIDNCFTAFLRCCNILRGEPSDIRASQILILPISNDLHLYLLILLITQDFIIPSNFTLSKINFLCSLNQVILLQQLLGLIKTSYSLTPSISVHHCLLSPCLLLFSLDFMVHYYNGTLKIHSIL